MSGGPGNDPPETGRWWPDSTLNSYCKNFNTRLRGVSERMWPIHAQGMYKIFSFIAFSYREMSKNPVFSGAFSLDIAAKKAQKRSENTKTVRFHAIIF